MIYLVLSPRPSHLSPDPIVRGSLTRTRNSEHACISLLHACNIHGIKTFSMHASCIRTCRTCDMHTLCMQHAYSMHTA